MTNIKSTLNRRGVKLIERDGIHVIVSNLPDTSDGAGRPLYEIQPVPGKTATLAFYRYLITGDKERVMTLSVDKMKEILQWLPILMNDAEDNSKDA